MRASPPSHPRFPTVRDYGDSIVFDVKDRALPRFFEPEVITPAAGHDPACFDCWIHADHELFDLIAYALQAPGLLDLSTDQVVKAIIQAQDHDHVLVRGPSAEEADQGDLGPM